jgi:hypothetical protein
MLSDTVIDKKRTQTKLEGGIVFQRSRFEGTHHQGSWSPWKMITDRREDWFSDMSAHPDSPITVSEYKRYEEQTPVCPYCGHEESDYWEYSIELNGDTYRMPCANCDESYDVVAVFPGGFTSTSTDCATLGKPHQYVFIAQYAHEGATWRIFDCVHCEYADRYVDQKNPRTLLPWRDEYNDLSYFDPDGVLDTGMVRDAHKPTEILSELGSGYSPYRWGRAINILNMREQREKIKQLQGIDNGN